MTTIPADLAGRWTLTADSLAAVAWSLHIALDTYPPPACFDIARRYETKAADVAALRAEMAAGRKPKKARPLPATIVQEMMEL